MTYVPNETDQKKRGMSPVGSVDFPAALDGMNPAVIVLPLVFLTTPGVAASRWLRRFRGDAGPRPAKVKDMGQWLIAKLASFATMLAMLMAGLGLVPLALTIYKAIAGINKYAPAVIGLVLLALLFTHMYLMWRDLKDAKVDKPALWMTPAPILAVLMLVGPVVWHEITDQAGQTMQMVFGGTPDAIHSDNGDDKPKKAHHSSSHGKGK